MSNDNSIVRADIADDRIARFVIDHPANVDLSEEDAQTVLRFFGANTAVPITLPCVGMKLELMFDIGESEQR